MIVVAVGCESRWGRIKAKLVVEQPDTPLQTKLDNLAQTIGFYFLNFLLLLKLDMLEWVQHLQHLHH